MWLTRLRCRVSSPCSPRVMLGEKTFGPLIADQPVLAIDVVRHLGEPVALVVAESKLAAQRA